MSTISAGTTSTTTLIHSGDTTGSLVLKTNDTGSGGTTAVTIDTSQNVGIGTSSPAYKLDVSATSFIAASVSTSYSGAGNIRIADASTTSGSAPYIGSVGNNLTFGRIGTAEYMRIDSSGNVGIGTSSPARKLVVASSAAMKLATAQGALFSDTANDGGVIIGSDFAIGSIQATNAAGTSAKNLMLQAEGGNLLVGTTANAITAYSASKSLVQSADYSGAVAQLINSTSTTGTQYFLAFGRGASVCGQITSGATNSTTYATSSDYRLKKDVQPMKGALAKVQALKPCTYKWIEDDTTSEGFIAHELAEVCPDAVVGEKDAVNAEGNPVYQGVDTSFLVATLTAAIQEQQALIQQLQADVAALKGTS